MAGIAVFPLDVFSSLGQSDERTPLPSDTGPPVVVPPTGRDARAASCPVFSTNQGDFKGACLSAIELDRMPQNGRLARAPRGPRNGRLAAPPPDQHGIMKGTAIAVGVVVAATSVFVLFNRDKR